MKNRKAVCDERMNQMMELAEKLGWESKNSVKFREFGKLIEVSPILLRSACTESSKNNLGLKPIVKLQALFKKHEVDLDAQVWSRKAVEQNGEADKKPWKEKKPKASSVDRAIESLEQDLTKVVSSSQVARAQIAMVLVERRANGLNITVPAGTSLEVTMDGNRIVVEVG